MADEIAIEDAVVPAMTLLTHPMFEGEGSIPKANVRAVIVWAASKAQLVPENDGKAA